MKSTLPSSNQSSKTKFEEELKLYFPDIYQFYALLKFDRFYREMLDGILDMVNTDSYGSIEIIYQRGKINYVNQKKQLTAEKAQKLTKPQTRL